MDIHKIPELLSISDFSVGFGGCRNDGNYFDCCEYNITVFDEKSGESIHEFSDHMVKLHHCSISESNVGVLAQLKNLTILKDDQWNLRMLLAKIKEKDQMILNSYSQSSLVDASILANKAREDAKTKNSFAPIWIKCASYFLADALFSINSKRPSPAHMLEITRQLKKNEVNQIFSLIHQILGVERASVTVLPRMLKSTMGFSDMVEGNGHSRIIKRKYDYFIENSLLSDCYFYLGYLNRNNITKVKNSIHRNPEFIHILRVGLDVESDPLLIERQASTLLQRINELLVDVKNQK
jgi:uncharacterized protein YqkB